MAAKVVNLHQGKKIPKRKLKALMEYTYNFGMGLQLVNDIADFVPPELNEGTSAKESTDSYSDIKNGKMTLPIIYMLERTKDSDGQRVIDSLERGFDSGPEDLRETTNIFLRSGAYAECRRQCREYKEKCSNVAGEFGEPARFLLSRSAIILDSNRYFSALTKLNK